MNYRFDLTGLEFDLMLLDLNLPGGIPGSPVTDEITLTVAAYRI